MNYGWQRSRTLHFPVATTTQLTYTPYEEQISCDRQERKRYSAEFTTIRQHDPCLMLSFISVYSNTYIDAQVHHSHIAILSKYIHATEKKASRKP